MSNFEQRQHELERLAGSRTAKPEDLEGAAWEVVSNILYEKSEEDVLLLPAIRPIVEKLAAHGKLNAQSDVRLDASILLASWGVLSAFGRGREVVDKIRRSSRRQLGALVARTTNESFDLDSIKQGPAQKMCEVIILQLLQRNSAKSGVFGLPAPPGLHHFEGIYEGTGTTEFQVYGVVSDRLVPVAVSRFHQDRMEEPGRYRGVLIVALGQFLLDSARSSPPLMKRSQAQGSIKNGQRWLVNRAAQLLANEGNPELCEEILPEGAEWLDKATSHLTERVRPFNAKTAPTTLPRLTR